jgi:hypothetical protein
MVHIHPHILQLGVAVRTSLRNYGGNSLFCQVLRGVTGHAIGQ